MKNVFDTADLDRLSVFATAWNCIKVKQLKKSMKDELPILHLPGTTKFYSNMSPLPPYLGISVL